MGDVFPTLPDDSGAAAASLPDAYGRLLILGASSLDRSALLAALAEAGHATLLDANVALPICGPPGAVSLGRWQDGQWQLAEMEPLCSLDTARFRLPLTSVVDRLARRANTPNLLIGAPGLRAGVAGAELTSALIEALSPDAIIVLEAHLATANVNELAASSLPTYRWRAPPDPAGASAGSRARARTRLWDEFLESGRDCRIERSNLLYLGTPPTVDESWDGRQVALARGAAWLALGEVIAVEPDALIVRLVGTAAGADRVLVRDAGRAANHELRTISPPGRPVPLIKQSSRAPMEIRSGPLIARLANGVTGDPLLQIRLRHRRSSLLFDVGECAGLSRRVLHTVSDLFLSHAHLDHVAGFVYLLRSRLSADLPPMRVYGPPGTREHIAGYLAGVCWDRIGDDGPVFEIREIDARRHTLTTTWLQAGRETAEAPQVHRFQGTLVETPDFTVIAAELDHGIPVLCYALSLTEQHNVDPDRLQALALPPGPWLGDLKAAIGDGRVDEPIALPDGTHRAAGDLAALLLEVRRGSKIVYATDFADTPANRRTLAEIATGADVLICEASFREADRAQAQATQHLTTTACGEIARGAAAKRLLPFHFSKRYEGGLETAYEEIERSSGPVRIIRHPACSGPGGTGIDGDG